MSNRNEEDKEDNKDLKFIAQNNETNLKFVLKIGDESREFYSYTILFGRFLKCKLIQTIVDNKKEDIYEVEMCDHLPYIQKNEHFADFATNINQLNELFLKQENIILNNDIFIYYLNYLGMPSDMLWNLYESAYSFTNYSYRIASELTLGPFMGKKMKIVDSTINNIGDSKYCIDILSYNKIHDKDLIRSIINIVNKIKGNIYSHCTDGWHEIIPNSD